MPPDLTPVERVLRARQAAYKKHAMYDPKESTKAATAAQLNRFTVQAQKAAEKAGETLTDEELARRADCLLRSYMSGLALQRSKAQRRAKEGARAQAS